MYVVLGVWQDFKRELPNETLIKGKILKDREKQEVGWIKGCFVVAVGLWLALWGALAQTPGSSGGSKKPTYPFLKDPASLAAIACGEPPLQTILLRQGYKVDTVQDEVDVQRFLKAGRGPVVFKPIAAYGLYKICSAGWYPVKPPSPANGEPPPPQKHLLWRIDAPYNKQDFPPVMEGSRIQFNPGKQVFGLWVSTAGFPNETVCTEDALQVYVPRFKPDDRHKAHVIPAKDRKGHPIPNTYLIGWEYSTNNDDQDVVTLVSNVKPAP